MINIEFHIDNQPPSRQTINYWRSIARYHLDRQKQEAWQCLCLFVFDLLVTGALLLGSDLSWSGVTSVIAYLLTLKMLCITYGMLAGIFHRVNRKPYKTPLAQTGVKTFLLAFGFMAFIVFPADIFHELFVKHDFGLSLGFWLLTTVFIAGYFYFGARFAHIFGAQPIAAPNCNDLEKTLKALLEARNAHYAEMLTWLDDSKIKTYRDKVSAQDRLLTNGEVDMLRSYWQQTYPGANIKAHNAFYARN